MKIADDENLLRRILAQKSVIAGLTAQISAREDESEKIFDDQQRLRENLKSLKGSAEEKALLQRYTRQLDDQETQLAGLRKKIQDTEAQRDEASALLQKMIDELQLEASF